MGPQKQTISGLDVTFYLMRTQWLQYVPLALVLESFSFSPQSPCTDYFASQNKQQLFPWTPLNGYALQWRYLMYCNSLITPD
jgi:hypothetical protein